MAIQLTATWYQFLVLWRRSRIIFVLGAGASSKSKIIDFCTTYAKDWGSEPQRLFNMMRFCITGNFYIRDWPRMLILLRDIQFSHVQWSEVQL
jgi:hypothetical protein